MIEDNIKCTKKLMMDKLMQRKEARTYYDWLFKDLGSLNTHAGKEVIKMVCEYFYQYCKHLNLLDCMRWKMLFEQHQTTTIGDVVKQIERYKKAKNNFLVQFVDELREKEYPQNFIELLRMQSDQNDLNKSMKKKRKMKSPEKEGELQSPGKRRKTVGKKGGKKGKQEEMEQEADDPLENLDQPCFFFQMDKFYLEHEIPKKDLDCHNPPTLDFDTILKSAQQEVPGAKKESADLEQVQSDEFNYQFIQENPWGLNIHSVIYSCVIQMQRNQT